MQIHHLSGRDVSAKTATCSVCGPSVRIGRTGNGWACSTKLREHRRRYRERHPDRARKTGDNPHALTTRNEPAATATCAVCGPDAAVQPWGRGWICSARAAELGRTVAQDRPNDYCRDCLVADAVLVWLTDGGCRRCAETDLALELAKVAADERLVATGADLGWGFSLVGARDPYEMPDYESAVPGWKTLPTG